MSLRQTTLLAAGLVWSWSALCAPDVERYNTPDPSDHATPFASIYSRIAFRWDSDVYVSPAEAVATLRDSPEQVALALAGHLAEEGGRVINQERSPSDVFVPPKGQACWEAYNAYVKDTFATYASDNFTLGKRTDANDAYYTSRGVERGCAYMSGKQEDTLDGWFVNVELASRQVTGPVDGTWGARRVTLMFSSRVKAWIFRKPGELTTQVRMLAVPTQGDVEASNGASIMYGFWREVTGEREAVLVRKYLAWLKQNDGSFGKPPTRASATSLAPPAASGRVAVLEVSGDALSLEERGYLTDGIRSEIVDRAGAQLAVMTRENMEVMLTDMGISPACVSEGACEVETARNLGVDYVVTSKVLRVGDRIVVTLMLHEVRSGRLVVAKEAQGADVLGLRASLAPAVAALLKPTTP